MSNDRIAVTVVSHAASVPANQKMWSRTQEHGIDLTLVTPKRWRHDYSPKPFTVEPSDVIGSHIRLRVAGLGNVPLHTYVAPLRPKLQGQRLLHLDQEPFSLSAAQWGHAARHSGVPYTFSTLQNILKRYPGPIRISERTVQRGAAMAFSVTQEIDHTMRSRGFSGSSQVVPLWVDTDRYLPVAPRADPQTLRLGFIGRLVEEKGVNDLVQARRALDASVEITAVGAGPAEGILKAAGIDVRPPVEHSAMHKVYGSFDAIVVPSRTTATWKEQFGRVVVEALACQRPVICSDSGSLPALVAATGGGLTFREGDISDLTCQVNRLRNEPELGSALASAGLEQVRKQFSADAVASDYAAAWTDIVSAR